MMEYCQACFKYFRSVEMTIVPLIIESFLQTRVAIALLTQVIQQRNVWDSSFSVNLSNSPISQIVQPVQEIPIM
jgi:hypothetical protein